MHEDQAVSQQVREHECGEDRAANVHLQRRCQSERVKLLAR